MLVRSADVRVAAPKGTLMTTPNDGTPTYAPGWYPDTNAPGTERWYDGTAWTEHSRPATAAAATVPLPDYTSPAAAATPAVSGADKKPWFKRKAIVIPVGIVAGLIVISGIGNALGGSRVADNDPVAATGDKDTPAAVVEEEVAEEPEPVMVEVPDDLVGMTASEAEAALAAIGLEADYSGESDWEVLSADPGKGEVEEGSTVALILDEPPALTLAQENAVRSAESYLSFTSFSKKGLIEQLTSEYGEGFEAADAKFAVKYLEENDLVDWNAEAVEAAESYLELTSFSRSGLYDQLTSDYGSGFTDKQAKHALKAVGY